MTEPSPPAPDGAFPVDAFPDDERPRLRDDLDLEFSEDEAFVGWLIDRNHQRRIRMQGVGLALCRLLDGTRTPAEVLRDLEKSGARIRKALLDQTLTFFIEQGLLAGYEQDRSDEPRMGRVAIRASEAAPREFGTVTVLDEARHNCVGCGQCCKGYNFGPLREDEVTRISDMKFEEDGARLGRATRISQYDYNGENIPTLSRREDGRCIFLADDQRCIIHREHGAEAKPWFCQTFPVHFVASPNGDVSGYLQMECFGFHEASTHGPFLREREDDIHHMLTIVPDVPVLYTEVSVGEGRQLTFEEYGRLEKRLLDHIRDWPGKPGDSLVAVGHTLRELETGVPYETVIEVTLSEEENRRRESHEFVGAISRFARMCLLDVYPPGIDALPRGTTPDMQRFYLDALTYYSSEGDADEVLAVDAVASPEEDSACVDVLRYFLRNEIFSKEWYRIGDLRRGFALTLARYELACAGARVLSHRWEESSASPKALSHSLSSVLRNLRGVLLSDASPKIMAALDRIYTAWVH